MGKNSFPMISKKSSQNLQNDSTPASGCLAAIKVISTFVITKAVWLKLRRVSPRPRTRNRLFHRIPGVANSKADSSTRLEYKAAESIVASKAGAS